MKRNRNIKTLKTVKTLKTESFKGLVKNGRFAKTFLNDMKKAGKRAGKALK